MGTAVLPAFVTEEEYLANPEYEHCEYFDGQAVPLNLGTKKHSKAQGKLIQHLNNYLNQRPIGFACTELHCLIRDEGQQRYRLPDVAVEVSGSSTRLGG